MQTITRITGIMCLAAAMSFSATADDVLFDYPADQMEKMVSVRNMDLQLASTADDFTFYRDGVISEFTAYFWIGIYQAQPQDWEIMVYEDDNGKPAESPFFSLNGGSSESAQQTWLDANNERWNLYAISWEFDDLELEPGRYWVVVRGVGPTAGSVYWASANTGMQYGSSAMFLCEELEVEEWTSWQEFTKDCLPVDGAVLVKGTGGGIPNRSQARLEIMKIRRGELLRGNRRDLKRVDSEVVTARSLYRRGRGRLPLMVAVMKFNSEVEKPESLTIKTVARITEAGGIGEVYIRNWKQGGWDEVGRFALGLNNNFNEALLNSDEYIHPDVGTIKVKVRMETPIPMFGTAFWTHMDQVRVDVIHFDDSEE